MTDLPKFVRDQMARTPAPSSHPDADLLTAFAENTLIPKERQQVIEHLSACADCREVVFLAQPEAVQTQIVLAPKPRRFTWMTWGSVAAVVVVVASAVILQQEQVSKTPPPLTVATTTAPSSEAKPTAPQTKIDEKTAPSITTPRAVAPRRGTNLGAGKAHREVEPLLFSKDIAANEEQASLQPPAQVAAPQSDKDQGVIAARVSPQQTPTGPQQRNIAGQIQQTQGPSNTANNVNTAASDNLAKAASTPTARAAKKKRADAFQGLATEHTAARAAAPLPAARAHWRISANDSLERSYGADNWTPVLAETGAKFHVVSVIGNTLWAGGEHGALYVSRDGGATWNSITIDMTETITSIYFFDDLRGILETADGQVWKTADAGKTWQRQ